MAGLAPGDVQPQPAPGPEATFAEDLDRWKEANPDASIILGCVLIEDAGRGGSLFNGETIRVDQIDAARKVREKLGFSAEIRNVLHARACDDKFYDMYEFPEDKKRLLDAIAEGYGICVDGGFTRNYPFTKAEDNRIVALSAEIQSKESAPHRRVLKGVKSGVKKVVHRRAMKKLGRRIGRDLNDE